VDSQKIFIPQPDRRSTKKQIVFWYCRDAADGFRRRANANENPKSIFQLAKGYTNMSYSRLLGCRMAAALFVLSALAQSVRAETIYQETFPNSSGSNATLASVGWFGYAGTTSTVITNDSTKGIVSYLAGEGSDTGFLSVNPSSWSGSRALVGTYECSGIALSAYNSLTFSWYQSVAATDVASQLAIEIGTTWYVSSDTFTNTATGSGAAFAAGAVSQSITLSATSTWYVLTTATMSLSTTTTTLPTTGTIAGAGLYITGSNSDRIDNFTISGAAVPEPATLALLGVGLCGFVAYAWRRWKN
jgi:hypothetical protein